MGNSAHRNTTLAAVTLALAAFGGIVSAQLEPLRGTVVNEADRGIKDVQVILLGGDTGEGIDERTTDDDGSFEIPMESVRPGLEIHLHKDGYEDVVLPISAQHLVVANLRVVMHPTRVEPTPRPPTPTPPPTLVTPEQITRAILLYNEAVEKFKEDEPAQKREAEQMIREAASLDPSFVEAHQVLLNLAMNRENWSEASRWAEHLVRLDPQNVEAVRTLYTTIVVTRHHERIGPVARQLALLDPSAIAHIEEHAQAFFTNQQYPMARAMYEVLAEISPTPAYAYLNLGVCCSALGDIEGARRAFERFLEIAPSDDPDRATVEADLAALDDTSD